MGYEKKTYFARIIPIQKEVTACIRAEVRKKERGSFEKLAYWRTSLKDKVIW
jgi:hypothetical protein